MNEYMNVTFLVGNPPALFPRGSEKQMKKKQWKQLNYNIWINEQFNWLGLVKLSFLFREY